jgi:hypothetical protein
MAKESVDLVLTRLNVSIMPIIGQRDSEEGLGVSETYAAVARNRKAVTY